MPPERQRGEEIKGLKGICGVMQKFSMLRHFTQQELKSMCRTGCSHGEKQNNTAPSPARSQLTPLTPLTCIAGLVGVKIDWQSLNWKWSLNAACSCWGFEFSLPPASQPADGENWWGACRGTEQRSQGSSRCIVHSSVPLGALDRPQRASTGPVTAGTVELRWVMQLSARPVMRIRA